MSFAFSVCIDLAAVLRHADCSFLRNELVDFKSSTFALPMLSWTLDGPSSPLLSVLSVRARLPMSILLPNEAIESMPPPVEIEYFVLILPLLSSRSILDSFVSRSTSILSQSISSLCLATTLFSTLVSCSTLDIISLMELLASSMSNRSERRTCSSCWIDMAVRWFSSFRCPVTTRTPLCSVGAAAAQTSPSLLFEPTSFDGKLLTPILPL
mmetsp:Transcript_29355/g.69842  ORF Transcript_29355/g.69842 Transcript_29355/m.69842 type:complete len:211 (-) Transcript_29355:19-651(-)